jgi:hypothetical protein
MKVFSHVVIIATLLRLATSNELISFEPIQYLKSKSLSCNVPSVWSRISEASPQEIAEVSLSVKHNLNNILKGTKANIVFAKGERIIAKKVSSKTALTAARKVPFANLIALFSVSMTIILEGFQSKLINKPIGEILKGDDLLNPVIEGYEARSLLEILCMLGPDSSEIDSDLDLNYLNRHGEVALFFANSVLGNTAKEAWMDALMAFNIENFQTDSDQLKLSLHDIFQYVLAVIHDFQVMQEATSSELPIQNPRYLFGWWLNCPKDGNCTFPDLPKDLIYSVSSSLRIYISPTFELSLIASDVKSNTTTLKDVIHMDQVVWKQVYSVLNGDTDTEMEQNVPTGDLYLAGFIHGAWPIVVFIFWVVSSHVWVYWMFHCCWFVATSVSKRTHVARPKLAAK